MIVCVGKFVLVKNMYASVRECICKSKGTKCKKEEVC